MTRAENDLKEALEKIWLESMANVPDYGAGIDRLEAIFGIARRALAKFAGVEPSNLPVPKAGA